MATALAKRVAFIGIMGAVYAVLTITLAPISYMQLQFRVSEVLKPLALYSPWMAPAFMVGNFIANLPSPFGIWDWGAMPLVDGLAAWLCWRLRAWPLVAVVLQVVVISLGVAVFPLGLGARLPIPTSFVLVGVSEVALLVGGYWFIWRHHYLKNLLGRWI